MVFDTVRPEAEEITPEQPPSSLLYPFGHIIPLTNLCP